MESSVYVRHLIKESQFIRRLLCDGHLRASFNFSVKASSGLTRLRKMAKEYVDFDGLGDTLNPVNWPLCKRFVPCIPTTKCSNNLNDRNLCRVYISVLLGFTTMVVAMASSIFTSAIPDIMAIYSISREVATLGVSL